MFFLLELLSKTNLFLKRGAERGGEKGVGWGKNLRPFKPPTHGCSHVFSEYNWGGGGGGDM